MPIRYALSLGALRFEGRFFGRHIPRSYRFPKLLTTRKTLQAAKLRQTAEIYLPSASQLTSRLAWQR
jgi:hypothetical protein